MMSMVGFWASPAVSAPVVATAMLSIIIFLAPIRSESSPMGIDRIAETRLGIDEISPTCWFDRLNSVTRLGYSAVCMFWNAWASEWVTAITIKP